MKYQAKIDKKCINSNDLTSEYKNVFSDNNIITYETNVLNNEEIYEKNSKKIYFFIKKHLISILSLIIILLFLFNLNFSFIRINIKGDNISVLEKEEILNDFSEYYHSFLLFKYLKYDIEDINNDLKSKYYQYEWLNIYNKGIDLVIDLRPKDNFNVNIEDNKVGDLVANQNGIIYSSYVQKGVLLVKQNHYVMKDDVLVSGNLKYNINQEEYVRARGFVIACVFDMIEIEVQKEQSNLIRSGRIQVYNQYKFLNKEIVSDYEIYETEIIEGKYPFSKDKIIVYELIEVINEYSYDEALEYAKSQVLSDFNNDKVHKDEKIIESILINNQEDSNNYYFTFIVKAYKNIAVFKEYKNNK